MRASERKQEKNLMRLSEEFLEFLKLFSKRQQKLYNIFHLNKAGYKSKIHLRINRKYWYNFVGLKKKYSTADQIPLGLRKEYWKKPTPRAVMSPS